MKINPPLLISLVLLIFSQWSLKAQEFTIHYEMRTEIPDSLNYETDKMDVVLEFMDSLFAIRIAMNDKELISDIIINTSNNEGLMLIKTNSQQIAERLTDSTIRSRFIDDTSRIEFVKGTKEILGEECKKAILSDNLDNETIIWYLPYRTPSINVRGFMYSNVPGIIMETREESIFGSNIVRAVSFSREMENPEEVFDFDVPEGYLIAPKGM